MASNYVSGVLEAKDREQIMAFLANIREMLPFMLEMSTKDKRTLPKMGDKSRAFVHKALEVGLRHPECLPRSFNPEEMKRDVELFDAMYAIAMAVNQLKAEIDDTLVAVGSDAYSAALQIYRHAKAHGEGIGLDAYVDDMGQRFGRQPRQAEPTE